MDRDDIERLLDELYAPDAAHGVSLATLVLHRGEVIAQRYGKQPDTPFGPGGPVDADTTLISWSMAKSITHAAVGLLLGDGRLELTAPAPVPAWTGTGKESITLQQLLEMRPGLEFVEDYVDDAVSHCLEMLYGAGQHDMAAYAASQPLLHAPGAVFNYSSGTTNIVSRIVGDVVGGGQAGMERFLSERLFGPAGMTTAVPKFDPAGTWVGSSYVYATARDFARFGELYRLDGIVRRDGEAVRVLPAGWADHARAWSATDEAFDYGAHWWLWRDFPGTFAAHGYEGQYTIVAPDRELVLVHLGKSSVERRPILNGVLARLIEAVPVTASTAVG